MSRSSYLHKHKRTDQKGVVRPRLDPASSRRADVPRRTAGVDLAGLQDAGNAAVNQWLDQHSGGQPLDPRIRIEMEAAFGQPFGDVRVHEDAAARATADALDATAFTHKADIHLGREAPAPESPPGKQLLAHELAHVVQQRRAGGQRTEAVNRTGDGFEADADRAAATAVQGQPAQVTATGAPPAVQRQNKPSTREQPPDYVRPGVASRAEAETALSDFLQKVLETQGGDSVRITPEISRPIERLLLEAKILPAETQRILNDVMLPKKPGPMAAALARRLPPTVSRATVEALRKATGVASPDLVGRARNLVEKSQAAGPTFSKHPAEDPRAAAQAQQGAERANEFIQRNFPRPTPPGGTPNEQRFVTPNIDVLQAARIVRGLPGVFKPPPSPTPQPPASVRAAIDRIVAQIAPDALIPAKVRGKPLADSLANAQDVARDLANKLDQAHQQKRAEVELQLGEGYRSLDVDDRDEVINAMRQIIDTVRNGLPHNAANVEAVKVYFGIQLPRRFPLRP